MFLLHALALAAAPPRASLGQFGRWGAFREAGGCLAAAEPVTWRDDPLRPFAAVTVPPGGVGRRLQLRLSRVARGPVTARVAGVTFALAVDGVDATLADARRLVAAIRRGALLRVAATDDRGRGFEDFYPLRGAASAIDAAAVGCLPAD